MGSEYMAMTFVCENGDSGSFIFYATNEYTQTTGSKILLGFIESIFIVLFILDISPK